MREEKQQILYEDKMIPAMAEGRYKLVFGQQIRVLNKNGKEEAADYEQKEQEFQVSSENRLQIPSTSIHSFYPPQGARGDFQDHIAQITFMTAALPWERPLIERGVPWICLLLIDGSDGVKIQEGTVGELFHRKTPSVYTPPLEGADPKASCRGLDVETEKLLEWLPKREDLPYLVHIRQVSVEDKATHLYRTEGRFSNLICNRIPRKGEKGEEIPTQVHVVSLEGYEWLYKKDEEKQQKPGDKTMRILSLASWEFISASQSEKGFLELSEELDIGPFQPALEDLPKGAEDPMAQEITAMLQAGYFPMDQETREGLSAWAWYRGPLVPYVGENRICSQESESQACVNDSDGDLAYLEKLDMLDVTYGAAWQLGFLLGIKNEAFMEALYAIRQEDYEEDARKRSWEYAKEALRAAKEEETSKEEAEGEKKSGRLRGMAKEESVFSQMLDVGADLLEKYMK